MARTAKKQAPAKVEEDDDNEGWEDAVVEADGKDGVTDLRLRDWRDVERFREMKDLRRLVDDDYGLEEIFHIPLKPRAEALPRANKLVMPAKLLPAKPEPKAAAKPQAHAQAQAKKAPAPPKAKPKAHAKPAPSSARARTEGVKAKAKKR